MVGFGPHRVFWRTIWKFNIPPKVHIFTWRVGHDLLPINAKIAAINQSFNCSCLRCNGAKETLIHALRDYAKAWDVPMCGGSDDRLLKSNWSTGINWLESVMRLVDGKVFECLVMLLWNTWNSRNNFIFRGKDEDAKII